MLTVYTYLVSDVGDVSGELSIRGKLSHMLNKVLDHLQVTLENSNTFTCKVVAIPCTCRIHN